MALLEYEKQIFLDAFHDDGLLVIAKGLGVERIFISFLKLYCDPGNLVLVLNTTPQDEEYFIEQIENDGSAIIPKAITTEYSANDRQRIYSEGGVLFVTSRILVVDLLTNKIPIHLVSGILVYKAHKIIESCQEAFILRLYREKNKTGFVKAFSDNAVCFTLGFCQVERVMKSLFVRKLFLWPRFHASVVSVLDRHKVDVVELQLQMTTAMTACQTALLDLVDACVKEIKLGNPRLDTEEITVETALTRGLDRIVRLYLDPVWHQLSAKTRQLVTDVKTLRQLLEYLSQCDCVNFYHLVNSIRSGQDAFGSNSGWLFMDAADHLFMHARSRVYEQKKHAEDKESRRAVLEECPKWLALKDVLAEIEEENAKQSASVLPGSVLIAAADDRTCSQIKQYLCEGSDVMLTKLLDRIQGKKTEQGHAGQKGKGRPAGKTAQSAKSSGDTLTLTQMMDTGDIEEKQAAKKGASDAPECPALDSVDAYCGLLQSPLTILHPLRGAHDPHGLVRTLQQLQPRFVILYDADVVFVRQLELFKASRPGVPLRVYFLMYGGSTEEQRYLTSLRREQEAFEYLIREKASMVIPEERDGKLEDDPYLGRDPAPANATVNTRKGGGPRPTSKSRKVIVDMREFRSELPSLIHRRGIDIEPVTLEVGDYILTPDICVERKSVSDLIGSLNNGRLYNQAVSMCRHYKRPVLLIEFDPSKPFSLQAKQAKSGELSSQDVMSRLTLLTIHFPRLRILWCQSPYATAELFDELKAGRDEPDASTALTVTSDSDADLECGKYSHAPKNMLLKMPGLNTKNVCALLHGVDDLVHLVSLSPSKLTDILGSSSNAAQLHAFLHRKHLASTAGGGKPPPRPGGPRGGKRRR